MMRMQSLLKSLRCHRQAKRTSTLNIANTQIILNTSLSFHEILLLHILKTSITIFKLNTSMYSGCAPTEAVN